MRGERKDEGERKGLQEDRAAEAKDRTSLCNDHLGA